MKIVTFWGPNDANSWRSRGRPLLFDGDSKPKPAFDAVINLPAARRAVSTILTSHSPIPMSLRLSQTIAAIFSLGAC